MNRLAQSLSRVGLNALVLVACAALVLVSASEDLGEEALHLWGAPPSGPAPETPPVPYAPAPGWDDRTPLEYVSQIFGLDDPELAAKLSGVGPVFWKGSHGTGALIAPDLVLTTGHLFASKGNWIGANTSLPIPPDPSGGKIYLAACGRSYAFAAIEPGSMTPRADLGRDYAIARLKTPACKAARVLPVSGVSEEEIDTARGERGAPVILSIGAYRFADLPRYAGHPLFAGRDVKSDPMRRFHVFGVRCRITGFEAPKPDSGLIDTEGADGVPGGSGGPLLIDRGGARYEIIGVANSYRPNSEFNNFTRVTGDLAAHLARLLPGFAGTAAMSDAREAATPAMQFGPWLGMED